jgi:hypothetical protein
MNFNIISLPKPPTADRAAGRHASVDTDPGSSDARSRASLWIERAGIGVALILSVLLASGVLSCGACRTGFNFAPLGAIFYALLLLAHLGSPEGSVVRYGIVTATSIHAGLVYQMVRTDHVCATCLIIAGVVSGLFIATVVRQPRTLLSFAFICPVANIVLLVALSIVTLVSQTALAKDDATSILQNDSPAPSQTDPNGMITVYELGGCPYCERLRNETLPEIRNRYGSDLRIRFVDATQIPFVGHTPTIVIRGPRGPRVIEGFCIADVLDQAMAGVGIPKGGTNQ